jgi:hypothetical protein
MVLGRRRSEDGERGALGRGRRDFPFAPFRPRPFAGFAGTVLRLGALLVVASAIVFVGKRQVGRIGDRAIREPLKAGLVGLLVELMFVPALIVTVVLLLVTIVGIPLLALIPVVLLAAAAVLLLGFTAVAQQVGQWAAGRWGLPVGGPYGTTLAGILLVAAPILIARVVGLAGSGAALVAVPLAGVGFLLEYAAWTVGLGAATLDRFRPLAPQPPAVPPVSPVVSPT